MVSQTSENPKCSLVDLYSGPGGLSLGFQQSGYFQPVVAVEKNNNTAETYENNLNIKVIRKKVENINTNDLLKYSYKSGYDSIDVLIGGPPCRPFTTANKGSTRWDKIKKKNYDGNENVEHPDWYNFWKIVDSLKPKIIVAENVLGLKYYTDVVNTFNKRLSSSGYNTINRVLDAQYFGVPQKRNRLFIVGLLNYNKDINSLLPNNPPDYKIKKVTVKEAIGDLPELTNSSPGSKISNYHKGRPTKYQSMIRNGNTILFDHIVHSVHPIMVKRFQYIPQGYNLRKALSEGKISEYILKLKYKKGNSERSFSDKTLSNIHSNIYRRLKWKDVSYTITHVRKTVLIHPLQNRLLSIREAARLQSFPDWFRFSGSLSQQYQQIADAVPPLLAKTIASHINNFLDEHNKY